MRKPYMAHMDADISSRPNYFSSGLPVYCTLLCHLFVRLVSFLAPASVFGIHFLWLTRM